ncbi:hypothetical protein PIB30_019586 [Stylosanthes scabra]|uniref:Uncharacterized protein n=1 Tax=Stylosanthes scabra TaxID=79078 RepID=A0ABU6Y5C3_9FABA|nr:hypothetical protein [Stylosanthes scabra]
MSLRRLERERETGEPFGGRREEYKNTVAFVRGSHDGADVLVAEVFSDSASAAVALGGFKGEEPSQPACGTAEVGPARPL